MHTLHSMSPIAALLVLFVTSGFSKPLSPSTNAVARGFDLQAPPKSFRPDLAHLFTIFTDCMASWKTDLNLDPQASSGSLPANTHCGHPADGGEGVFDNACVLPNVTTILDIWLWDIGGCHECGHIDPCLPSPAKKRDVSVFPDTDAARFLPRQAEDGPHLPGNGCTSENNSTMLVDVAKLGIQRIATDCILDSNHGSVCDAPCFVTFGGHCDRQHLDDPNSCNLNGQRLERVCVDNGCIGDPDRVFRRT